VRLIRMMHQTLLLMMGLASISRRRAPIELVKNRERTFHQI
jgi:hypothetical protein